MGHELPAGIVLFSSMAGVVIYLIIIMTIDHVVDKAKAKEQAKKDEHEENAI